MDDGQIAEIRARAGAATSGPWHFEPIEGDLYEIFADDHEGAGCVLATTMIADEKLLAIQGKSNAEFCSRARTDIPRLLDEIERLKAELRRGFAREDHWRLKCEELERRMNG